MEGLGAKLRESRLRYRLSLRDVEERSVQLAERWGDPSYRISASWLNRVELGDRVISATKLMVLAAIYGLTAEQMLGLCPPGALDPTQYQQNSSPNSTVLLSEGTLQQHAELWLPEALLTDPVPEQTTLFAAEATVVPGSYRRAVIGKADKMLDPMIPGGSIVLVDTQRRAIAGRKQWNNEFDRPIYLMLTRTGYVAGFCELDKASEWLTLVPHALSFESSKRWRYRKEIEVVGTVVAVFMRRSGEN